MTKIYSPESDEIIICEEDIFRMQWFNYLIIKYFCKLGTQTIKLKNDCVESNSASYR